MSRTGIVNTSMVITEEKVLSNIDKVQKLINPNSKKQIIELEEDSYSGEECNVKSSENSDVLNGRCGDSFYCDKLTNGTCKQCSNRLCKNCDITGEMWLTKPTTFRLYETIDVKKREDYLIYFPTI